MPSIASNDPCDDDFEDYGYEDDESLYDSYCGCNGEECEYGYSYALDNDFESDDASSYDSSTYTSCDESNSEESDYGFDYDNEESRRKYCCSTSYYGSNSKLENCVENVVHRPIDDLNALISGDHLIERHEYNEAYINQFVERLKHMFHIYGKIEGLCGTMIIHNKSFTNIANSSMVEKLKLKARKHPQSYRIPWSNKKETLEITKKV
ncbi:hypothetical protein P3S68_004143 [Capsicum galapagoense]